LLGEKDLAELGERSFVRFVEGIEDLQPLVRLEVDDGRSVGDGVAELLSELVVDAARELLDEVDGDRHASEIDKEEHGGYEVTPRRAICTSLRWLQGAPAAGPR
jgi:hypothetical protein